MNNSSKIVTIGFFGLLALTASPAQASVISESNLGRQVGLGAQTIFELGGVQNKVAFESHWGYGDFDFTNKIFYNKSIDALAFGSVRLGSAPVAAGTVIDKAPSQKTVTFDAQKETPSFQNGRKVVTYTSKEKEFGTHLYLPASYTDKAGQQELGYFDLAITLNGTNDPYTLIVNGYTFGLQSDGVLRAGQGFSPISTVSNVSTVPLPASWALMATGFLGLGLVGPLQSAAAKRRGRPADQATA